MNISKLKYLSLFCAVAVACVPKSSHAEPRYSLKRIARIEGFDLPETVKHAKTQDVYYVSNMVGNPTAKKNNGFISKIDPESLITDYYFIRGGQNSVLHAPKGMAVFRGRLWVADIDALSSREMLCHCAAGW